MLHCNVPLWSLKAGRSRLLTRTWRVWGFGRASVINQKLWNSSSRSWFSHRGWTCCQEGLPLVYCTLHTDEWGGARYCHSKHTTCMKCDKYGILTSVLPHNTELANWFIWICIWWPHCHQTDRAWGGKSALLSLCTSYQSVIGLLTSFVQNTSFPIFTFQLNLNQLNFQIVISVCLKGHVRMRTPICCPLNAKLYVAQKPVLGPLWITLKQWGWELTLRCSMVILASLPTCSPQ